MATTLELPNDVWDIIVKQSKQNVTDLLKDLSIAELTEVVLKADREKEQRLCCVRNKYPRYAIINDSYNQKLIILRGFPSAFGGERYLQSEKVFYTIDTTLLGNYHKKNEGEYTDNVICGKIDLSTEKLIINNCHKNPIDFTVIQYQDDIIANRIARADNLKVGDTTACFKYVMSMSFTDTSWDYRSKQLQVISVMKNTPRYIFYDEIVNNIVTRRRVEKKYIVC